MVTLITRSKLQAYVPTGQLTMRKILKQPFNSEIQELYKLTQSKHVLHTTILQDKSKLKPKLKLINKTITYTKPNVGKLKEQNLILESVQHNTTCS